LLTGITAGADEYITANLGDGIQLHGSSYKSDQVYLFLTGPGHPANGVTLTDTSQRADQGHFTIAGVDSNQRWSLHWNTARIRPNIDLGTYWVYVTTEPVDYAHLGGTSSYQVLEVYFTDYATERVSISSGAYSLNPEKNAEMVTITVPITTTLPESRSLANVTVALTTAPTTVPVIPSSATPTHKAGSTSCLALLPLSALMFIAWFHSRKSRVSATKG
jgi:hypothetical protein